MVVLPKDILPKKGLLANKFLIIIAVAVVIAFIAIILYFYLSFTSIYKSISTTKSFAFPNPHINISLGEQDILSYNNSQLFLPYLLIGYSSTNVSSVNVNASIFAYPPPRRIFLLNISDECFKCGNTTAIEQSISSNLTKYGLIENSIYSNLVQYGVIQNSSEVSIVSISNIRSVPSNSILIIIDGLLPQQMLSPGVTGVSPINFLLNEHTSIVYMGQDFSRTLLPGSTVVPTPDSLLPQYLITSTFTGSDKLTGFYLNKSLFSFTQGTNYGPFTYVDVYNGSIVALPNSPSGWSSPSQTGSDIARVIERLFWLPRYAYGSRTMKLPSITNASGQFGFLLDSNTVYLKGNASNARLIDTGIIRVEVVANGTYPAGVSNTIYRYTYARTFIRPNGTIGLTPNVSLDQNVSLNFSIHTNSATPINITPYLTIYSINSTPIYNLPIEFIHNAPSFLTFLKYEVLPLPPGRKYIIKLSSFYGVEYAAGYFSTYPIIISPARQDLTNDSFIFYITSDGQQINNTNYTMSLNGMYPSNGVIKDGLLDYAVPAGTKTIYGTLNFTLNAVGGNSYLQEYYPQPFTGLTAQDQQYLEIAVVVVVMLLMIVLVRAPNRDEFYIDVPNLPEEHKTKITLKASEVVTVFDKLNTSYHWQYMPLSKSEIRSAISSYIKYNNIPVALTYNNMEHILDVMTVNKYLTTADNLYAPSQWTAKSGHDIEYLATFKKLRLYLVTHAYIFTDLDTSTNTDIIATLHDEKRYIVIHSATSKFQKIPVYTGSKTYITFLNSYGLEKFKDELYASTTTEAEELRMYIDVGLIRLMDADNPGEVLR